MFASASSFNSDVSKWNVSRVTDMSAMFSYAYLFNSDMSKWDVSRVTYMGYMFYDASSFNQKLCGEAWVNSKADKLYMFSGSPGSRSMTVCGVWSIDIVNFTMETFKFCHRSSLHPLVLLQRFVSQSSTTVIHLCPSLHPLPPHATPFPLTHDRTPLTKHKHLAYSFPLTPLPSPPP